MTIPRGKELVGKVGISSTYASDILRGNQAPSRPLAIAIYRKTNWKHPSIEKLTEEQLKVFEAVEPWRGAV